MSQEDFYTRLDSVLTEIEDPTLTERNLWSASSKLYKLASEAQVEERSVTPEQKTALWSRALEQLNLGNKNEFFTVSHVISHCIDALDAPPIDNSMPFHMRYKEGHPRPFDVMAVLLGDAGVFEPDETPLYYEWGILGVNEKTEGRAGLLLLTNKRLIAAGGYATTGRSYDRLFYDDWKEKPYLSAVDYVFLDGLNKLELKKDCIRAQYRTKYVSERTWTLYGPYFFKFDLPKRVKVKDGKVRIFAYIHDEDPRLKIHDIIKETWTAKAYRGWNQMWEEKEFPKDYNKNRLKALFEKIVEVQTGEGPTLR